MQKNEALPPNVLYTLYLRTIQNVNFTQREVDVIACLLNGRSSKKISSFLNISPRTADSHIRNISHKLECYSRESIIDFIEKAEEYPVVKNYYSNLVINAAFEKNLKEISGANKTGLCSLAYDRDLEGEDALLFHQLKTHLLLVVEQLPLEIIKDKKDLQKLVSCPKEHILYVLSDKLLKRLQINEDDALLKSFSQPQDNLTPYKALYVLLENKEGRLDALLHQDNLINFKDKDNYYLSFYKLLKQLCPSQNFERYVQEITSLCEKNSFSFDIQRTLPNSDIKETEHVERLPLDKLKRSFLNWKRLTIGTLAAVAFSSVIFILFKGSEHIEVPLLSRNLQGLHTQSDLVIPMESIFLNRSEVISQIDNTFKGHEGIQTTALVGIGGAGKTTLARQYAHQQKANVIWEINAETQENLKVSFESLAQELSKTAEDQKILRGLLDIKKPEEKEKKILAFVKDHLRAAPNWFLIFDNVENFTDIQNYFPLNEEIWGRGKILLTTRDRNIQNNSRVNHVVPIEELTQKQKLTLFTKIMNHGTNRPLTNTHYAEAEKFLENIPSFPLDVSVAAYYLKSTNTSYEGYLENLKKYDVEFSSVQESLLKEAGSYLKTRYGIITLSLERLTKSHKDFGELLLFISLLDSQNIPRDLLEVYKNKNIVDNFIYNLKKYSLIDNSSESFSPSMATFSIHRSTQAISLTYLIKELKLSRENPFILSLASSLEKYITNAIEKRNYREVEFLIGHCKALLNHDLLMSEAKAVVNRKLGHIYTYLGNHAKAQHVLEDSLHALQEEEKKNYAEIFQTTASLGNSYRENGYYEKAKILLEQNLAMCRQSLPENHVSIPQLLCHLGNVYREMGHYEKAHHLLEESLKIYKKYHSGNILKTAWVLIHLGTVHRQLGEYKKAGATLEKGLIDYKKLVPKNHLYLIGPLIYLANLFEDLGEYKKAQTLLEQSYYIQQQAHSENHIYAAWIGQHLANVYRKLGKYEKAQPLLEQSLLLYQKHLPENVVYINLVLSNLGNLYKDSGNYKKAKELLEKVLVAYEKHFGNNHIETARILNSLGQVSLLEGNKERAENLLNRAVGIFEQNKHPDVYIVLENIAELYQKKSKQANKTGLTSQVQDFKGQASQNLRQALEIVTTYFPENSPHAQRIQSKIDKLKRLHSPTKR